MSKVKGTHKFKIVKTLLEAIYALTWLGAVLFIASYFIVYPKEQALMLSAVTLGIAIFLSTMLILTISTVDTRNLLADIYTLNLAEAEAYQREIAEAHDVEIEDTKDLSEESKYDIEIAEFPRAA